MKTRESDLLVSMHVAGAVGIAEVDQGWVYHHLLLTLLQQILEIAKMSEAASDAIACTILIQHKHLTRCEPTLSI